MIDTRHSTDEMRVLLLAPTTRDADTSRDLLEGAGLDCLVCHDFDEICRELRLGAGAAIVTEEAVRRDRSGKLAEVLKAQPPWSDVPVLVLTTAGRLPVEKVRVLHELGNVSLWKRPLEIEVFLNGVRSVLRDRRRQYQVRDYVVDQARQTAALQEAARRKDEFLAMLAHELRNPLAPIRNGLQIMQLAEGNRDLIASTRHMMDRQVHHLARLVDDLLDVSRITRGKADLRRERIDLYDAVTRAVETTRPLIDARRHHLSTPHPGRPIWVHADLTRMAQVIGNLLHNAAKYTEEGGRIDLTLEEADGTALIRVRDNGVGMSTEILPNIFELFAQGDRTIDRAQGGLGIGLTLVRSLVEMHGGSVEARSQGQGTGSEFIVRLPTI